MLFNHSASKKVTHGVIKKENQPSDRVQLSVRDIPHSYYRIQQSMQTATWSVVLGFKKKIKTERYICLEVVGQRSKQAEAQYQGCLYQ
jgi:hypothetical protein